ncbi:phosphonoacetaldehyde hydrolase [Pontibacterium granulatum]|uniref:phosphonoacetaldehyde hydrolase n=1 Tax=Pontibacterium granulatum TaxID=2036029 RepID=UPI00249B01D2|nr:phosphonoacetaldehyde hydrolase [Pontibacterium granulatum]MDI3323912.1 phosphonoacetaldehyde hydrolase [Pontibacterium granulatum]
MTFGYQRFYTGPVTAVVFDWAGTTIDFGSLAPIKAFCGLFEEHGVPITLAEARAPMGAEKREHIAALLAMPRIREAWIDVKGSEPTEADIDALYDQFIPVQKAAIAERTTLIPGARETFAYLRDNDIKIGANTGYSQEMITDLRGLAAEQGYQPDSYVCATDVPRGRPYPHMTLKNMLELEVLNVQSVVKVDDTLTGIEEGLNAGCWTVGIAISGNEVGLDLADWEALSIEEQETKRQAAYKRFHQSGAHYVIDTVADLPAVIEDINARLSAGEQP